MSPLELKRKQLELVKVHAARAELEFRVAEREEEIIRLKENIQLQLKKEAELSAEIQLQQQ